MRHIVDRKRGKYETIGHWANCPFLQALGRYLSKHFVLVAVTLHFHSSLQPSIYELFILITLTTLISTTLNTSTKFKITNKGWTHLNAPRHSSRGTPTNKLRKFKGERTETSTALEPRLFYCIYRQKSVGQL